MAKSVDPDEVASYKPSHLDLHCLHRCLFRSAGLKGLILACLVNISADDTLQYFSYFFPENRFCSFMQIVSLGDNLHEMSRLFSEKNQKNLTNLSSSELT